MQWTRTSTASAGRSTSHGSGRRSQLSGCSTCRPLSISWRKNAAGWTDNLPWPPFVWNPQANPPTFALVAVDGNAPPTSATLRATTTIATVDPQPGQTLAVYNLKAGT